MEYTVESVDRIVEFKTWSDRKKLDELLYMDCKLYTELGIDSTIKEKEEVRRKSKIIYTAIKKINPSMGEDFLRVMDKK